MSLMQRALAASVLLTCACGGEPGGEPGGDSQAPTSETQATDSNAGAVATNTEAATRGVLLFVCDTLRADRLSCYGYERQTPGIDRLASLGTLFERHHSQGHWTLPSMISMLTGLYVHVESEALPAQQPTLAEWLSEYGVDTAAFVGNNVIGRERGFSRGFDHFHIVDDPMTRVDVLVDEFFAWLAEHERTRPGRPWFVWLHAMDPHAPYTPRPQDARYAREVTRPDLSELRPVWLEASPKVARASNNRPDQLSDTEAMRRMVTRSNAYDGEVLSIDRAVTRILEHFQSTKRLAETSILFASDHGEMLYEYPEYPAGISENLRRSGFKRGLLDWFVCGHESWFYPELWRTPMIAVGRGFTPNTRLSELSANIDIYPTVLDLFGFEHPPGLDGHHLLESAQRSFVYAHGRATTAMLGRDGLQLIDFGIGRYGPRPRQVLYDRSEVRLVDRSRERPEDVDRLLLNLATWRSERSFTPNMDVPEITMHALRQLGYAPLDHGPAREIGDDGPAREIGEDGAAGAGDEDER